MPCAYLAILQCQGAVGKTRGAVLLGRGVDIAAGAMVGISRVPNLQQHDMVYYRWSNFDGTK